MATENKTSKRLYECFLKDKDIISLPRIPEARAFAQKYKRMEEALELIASEGSLDADAELARKKLKAKDALLFDPLS